MEGKDEFPTGMEILKDGDPGLSAEYKALSKTLFGRGEGEDDMVKLIAELKEAIKKEGLEVPGGFRWVPCWSASLPTEGLSWVGVTSCLYCTTALAVCFEVITALLPQSVSLPDS